jgi:quercetin dioxygenase-like cupin family protein
MNWDEFITALEQDIDWDDTSVETCKKIESILAVFGRNAESLVNRIHEITSNPELFNDYLPHMECPRPAMDKFVLHMDRKDNFRVRLHRFKPPSQSNGQVPTIHSHRWAYATYILKGEYTEHLYQATENEADMTFTLVETSSRKYVKGQTNSLLPQIPHRIIDGPQDAPCLTLFVRGKSIYETSKVYNPETGKYRILHGLEPQLKVELLNLATILSNE